ncbi:unnamed protein product [Schistosoma turkestanicum]|nr:unnamed protein product [Schistosoma turkestanicum]
MNFIYTGPLLLVLGVASLSTMFTVMAAEFSNLDIPIEFNENNQMYLQVNHFKLVLDPDHQLTMKDGDCVTTVDLAAPNAKEIKANKAFRQVTRICTSWYTEKAKKKNTTSAVKK